MTKKGARFKMKKVLNVVLAAIGAGLFGVGVTSMTKKAVAYSVIGRADGPTSVFIAGKCMVDAYDCGRLDYRIVGCAVCVFGTEEVVKEYG